MTFETIDQYIEAMRMSVHPDLRVRPWPTVGGIRKPKRSEHYDHIADAYRNGDTIAAIKKRYRVGEGTIMAIVKAEGLPLRSLNIQHPHRDTVRKLHAQGMSQVKIAAQIGRSKTYVQTMIVREGWR